MPKRSVSRLPVSQAFPTGESILPTPHVSDVKNAKKYRLKPRGGVRPGLGYVPTFRRKQSRLRQP